MPLLAPSTADLSRGLAAGRFGMRKRRARVPGSLQPTVENLCSGGESPPPTNADSAGRCPRGLAGAPEERAAGWDCVGGPCDPFKNHSNKTANFIPENKLSIPSG